MPVENFSDQSTERRRARQDAAFGYAATDIRAPSPGVCPRSRERGFVCVMVCVCVSFFRLHLGEEGRVAGSQRPIVPSCELAGQDQLVRTGIKNTKMLYLRMPKPISHPQLKNSTPTRSNAFLSLLSGTTRYPRHRSNAQRTRSARPRAPLLPSLMTIYTFHSLRPPQCVSTGPGVVRLAGMANERTALRIAAEPLRDEMDS